MVGWPLFFLFGQTSAGNEALQWINFKRQPYKSSRFVLEMLHERLKAAESSATQPYDVSNPSRRPLKNSNNPIPFQGPLTNPGSPLGGPDLLSDDAQKLEFATGETLCGPPVHHCRSSLSRSAAGTELNLSLSTATSHIVAADCRLDVGDRDNGVAGTALSGERLCRMINGRSNLASV
jgi:hypothetical protein